MGLEILILSMLGYTLGSFPSAYLAGRLVKGIDIREYGDGNTGAANAFRLLGAPAGIAVGIADIGKGILVIGLSRLVGATETGVMMAGLFSVAGHNWPFFMGFRGGRGAATALGVLWALFPRIVTPLNFVGLYPLIFRRSTDLFFAVVFAPLPLVVWLMGASVSMIAYSVSIPTLVGMTHFVSTRGQAAAKLGELPEGHNRP